MAMRLLRGNTAALTAGVALRTECPILTPPLPRPLSSSCYRTMGLLLFKGCYHLDSGIKHLPGMESYSSCKKGGVGNAGSVRRQW